MAVAEVFPWAAALPAAEHGQFLADFARDWQAAVETGDWSPLALTIRGWRATAAIHADPTLFALLVEPVSDDFGGVPESPGW